MKFIKLTSTNPKLTYLINVRDIVFISDMGKYREIHLKSHHADYNFPIKETIDEIYGVINDDKNTPIFD